MKAPTMVYATNGDLGGVEGDGYWYKVVDANEVESALAEGWCEAPTDTVKKSKATEAAKEPVKRTRRTKAQMAADRQ